MMMATLEERFWSKVNVLGQDDCWMWRASKDSYGYGRISAGSRGQSPLRAHRVSWEIHNGVVPDGLVVCHKCDNTSCVNPSHLFVATQKVNILDALHKGRIGNNPASLANLNRNKRKEVVK